MPSLLIVVAGPPLPGRWALARAVARRLGALLAEPDSAPDIPLVGDAAVVIQGDFCGRAERARVVSIAADEHLLVEWICSRTEADREIFHRWATRPIPLAEKELARYLAWEARAVPVDDDEAQVVTRVGAGAPLSDQVLRVISTLQPRPDPLPRPERRINVLVVEDEPEQRILLGDVLLELGCTVELAPDAGVALALLEDDDHGIDLVISDERMPGMSGTQLAAEVAERHPDVRAVLLTAHPDSQTLERALDASASTVLRKPVSVVDLQRVIEEAG